jgi:hypothetical protein
MSSPNHSAILTPSWKTGLGLFAVTAGYLVMLVGTVFYTWGGMHELYGIPVLLAPAVGLLTLIVGGAMVWTERA